MNDPLTDLLLLERLLVAFVLCGAIGWERELTRKSAGLRTHILVGVSAALLMVLGERLVVEYSAKSDNVRFDLIGILGAVVSGISFLGAGAIFSGKGNSQKGLTTAATVLGSAAIGLACGLRHYVLALGVTLIFLLTLRGVGWLERRVFRRTPLDLQDGDDPEVYRTRAEADPKQGAGG